MSRYFPTIDNLENRTVPTVDLLFDGMGNLQIIGQPDGDLEVNFTGIDTFNVVDGGTTITTNPIEISGSLSIRTQGPAADNIFIILDGNLLTGNLSVETESGSDSISFNEDPLMNVTSGTILGNVSLNGMSFVNIVNLGIGGNLSIREAKNFAADVVLSDSSVGSNVTLSTGNESDSLEMNGTFIGSNVNIRMGNFDNGFTVDDASAIGGSVNYIGGSGQDNVQLEGIIGGNVSVRLGVSDQVFNSFILTGTIGRNLTVFGGASDDTVEIGDSAFVMGDPRTIIGGNVYINLSHSDPLGFNSLDVFEGATIGGSSLTYIGGVGDDVVDLDGEFNRTRIYASLGLSGIMADEFELGANLSGQLSYLYIDFGFGPNLFTNNFGLFTFPAVLRNLP